MTGAIQAPGMLEKAIRSTVLAALFTLPFLPLIVAPQFIYPELTGKSFAFRVIVDIMAGAWLALALVNPDYRPRRSWILSAIALFAAVIALANTFGYAPSRSFWGDFERLEGFIVLAHVFVFVLVASTVLRSETLWRRFWQVSLAVSIVIVAIAMLERAALIQLPGRGNSTLGNSLYLSGYLLFQPFIGALLLVQTWNARSKARWPAIVFYGCAIVGGAVAMLLSGARGPFLGLLAGALIAVLAMLLFGRGQRRPWRTAGALAIVVAITLGSSWGLRDSAWFPLGSTLSRLGSVSLDDPSIRARIIAFGTAWQGIKERPLLGWGQENFGAVDFKHFDPRLAGVEGRFDRVHNAVLEWWLAGGILGLLAYLSIFAAAVAALWRGAFSAAESSVLTGLLAGYFISNLGMFDSITTYIPFGAVLAYVTWREGVFASRAPVSMRSLVPARAQPLVAALVVAGALVSAWALNARALAANYTLRQALAPQPEGLTRNLELFKRAIDYGSFGTLDVRFQLALTTLQILQGHIPASDEIKRQFLNLALSELKREDRASPVDFRIPLGLARLLEASGDRPAAVAVLQRAREFSPRHLELIYELGHLAGLRDDLPAAMRFLAMAYQLNPDVAETRIRYAIFAVLNEDDALADRLLEPLIASGKAADIRILNTYQSLRRYDRIAALLSARIAQQPDDVEAYFSLAVAYYQQRNTAKALETLQQAKRVAPAVGPRVDALMDQMWTGLARGR